MQRIAAPEPETHDEAQRRVAAAVASGPRGSVRGPIAVWLHRPELADRAQALGAYCRYQSTLPPRLSELAILVTAKVWHAGYEWRAHAPMALAGGLAAEPVEALRVGQAPLFAHEDEAALYDFAVELNLHRRISDAVWERAERCLGTAGLVDLIGVLGYYSLISMTINAVRIGEAECARIFADTRPIAARAGVAAG